VHLVGILFIVVIADARNHEPVIYELSWLNKCDIIKKQNNSIALRCLKVDLSCLNSAKKNMNFCKWMVDVK
jgi:hypothetical protein